MKVRVQTMVNRKTADKIKKEATEKDVSVSEVAREILEENYKKDK